jgi:glutamate racemase
MREVARLLPGENLIYLGDTARVPYGARSPQTILRYTLECVSFLLEKKIKLLIIACHTASSHSLAALQKQCPVPVIGMIECGFRQLMETTKTGRVAILGTASTIGSGIYQDLIRENYPERKAFAIACPLFVPLIEEGLAEHPATRAIAAHYLNDLKEKKIDSALLACTHYPLIRSSIHEVLGPEIELVEPAESAAKEAMELLRSRNLLNEQKVARLQFYSTDDPDKFSALAKYFFGAEVGNIQQAALISKES